MTPLFASIFLFVVIVLLLTVVGFKFWVQPKTALERVIGQVELAQQSVPEPSLAFREIIPEISDELAVMNLEMRAGKRRAESLHNFGARTDVDECKKMVSVLIQADRFGTSISQTLRKFSDFMRVQMRQEIEEKAAKIGVKLVFPIFFFILPSLFVVTVGPIIVKVVRDFLPGLNQ